MSIDTKWRVQKGIISPAMSGISLRSLCFAGQDAGQVYGTVRSAVHAEASKVESSGTASAIIDMVRANKLGFVVIDA